MQTYTDIEQIRQAIQHKRAGGRTLAFVPTMGNLHAGHISLVKKASQLSDLVVVSIFVNPLQFGPDEDLENYPRTLQADQSLLQEESVSLVFAPSVADMYKHGEEQQTNVAVPVLGDMLCGSSRPGHFDGVTTVVNKLFNIVQPDIAVFGEKDFQQLAIIRKMVSDLSMPVEVVGMPIVREADGLAMSSRNRYLSTEERQRAPAFNRILNDVANAYRNEVFSPELPIRLVEEAKQALADSGFEVDYIEIRNAEFLQPADAATKRGVLLAAAYLGQTRLIDNIQFDCPAN